MNNKRQVLYMFYMHVYLTSFNFFIIIKASSDINFQTYFSRLGNAEFSTSLYIHYIFEDHSSWLLQNELSFYVYSFGVIAALNVSDILFYKK